MIRILAVAAILASSIATAQQVPLQHSPSSLKYNDVGKSKEPPPVAKKTEEAFGGEESVITVSWQPISHASRYLLKIARDPEMSQVFFTVETMQHSYVTNPLAPGQYFYKVFGYDGEREAGQTSTLRFVVGKPVPIERGDRRILPAPAIIGPNHLETFPAHGKVRMSWESVSGARGYRFRLWEESKIKEKLKLKKEIKPRWITEVEENWIEFRDAPYASFMYLDSGIYRWDVAAVNKDGAFVGDLATGYFKVSRQQHLLSNEAFMRFQYGINPSLRYSESSTPTGQSNSFSSISHRYDIDVDWWMLRQWGVNFAYGQQSLDVRSNTIFFFHTNLDVIFRTALSYEKRGWTLAANAGLGMQEYPEVDRIDPAAIHISRPRALGAHLGLRFNRRWQGRWGMELRGNILTQAFTLNGATGSGTTRWGLNGDLTLRMLYHWTEHLALMFGATAEYRRLSYLADPSPTASTVTLPGFALLAGVQLHFFPDSSSTSQGDNDAKK